MEPSSNWNVHEIIWWDQEVLWKTFCKNIWSQIRSRTSLMLNVTWASAWRSFFSTKTRYPKQAFSYRYFQNKLLKRPKNSISTKKIKQYWHPEKPVRQCRWCWHYVFGFTFWIHEKQRQKHSENVLREKYHRRKRYQTVWTEWFVSTDVPTFWNSSW